MSWITWFDLLRTVTVMTMDVENPDIMQTCTEPKMRHHRNGSQWRKRATLTPISNSVVIQPGWYSEHKKRIQSERPADSEELKANHHTFMTS